MCSSQGANRVASSCGVWQQKEVRSTTVKVDAGTWMLAGSNTEWWAAAGRWRAERTRIVFATADLKSEWRRSQTRGNLLHEVFLLQRLLYTYNYTKIWATKGSRWTFQDTIKSAVETSFAFQQKTKRSHMTTYKGYTQSTFIYALSPWSLAFSIKIECSMSSLICINTFLAVSEPSTVLLKCTGGRGHSTAG